MSAANTAWAVLVACGVAWGQTFEVASVKPSPPPPPDHFAPRLIRGGPGSTDPGSAIFQNADLFSVVSMAFDIKPYQFSGPDWLRTTRFDITAKIPPGSTTAQYRLMLQALLVERFHLAVHRDQKEAQEYGLVLGKNGSKLKPSTDDPSALDDGLQPSLTSSAPPGFNGPRNLRLVKKTIAALADILAGQLSQPVVDATGLTGRYDINLVFSGLQTDPGATAEIPTLFDAIQQQLGLKLVPKKALIDILVIDRVDKVPTEN